MSQKAKVCWNCRKKQITRKCVICGKEFTSKQSKNQQTCSKECAYKLRGIRSRDTQFMGVVKKCLQCGKEFRNPPSKAESKFCSIKCAYEYRKGEHNPQWRNGATEQRKNNEERRMWGKCIRTIWKRDNGTCQRCGKTYDGSGRRFAVHHIRPYGDSKEARYALDNLILLCPQCHAYAHSKAGEHSRFINRD
ncbi:MAG: HNH endonuclease [Anaerolineaceae bacterium]|nr:HNH endonuclease [Anaerolineaceae bacterium]